MSFTPFTQKLRDSDPSLRMYGFDLLCAERGRAVVSFVVTPQMANPLGFVQGGLLFAAADVALGFAANSVIEGAATADAQISYVSPGRVDDDIVAEAEVVYHDDRRLFVQAFVRCDDRVLASFHGSARAVSARGSGPR